MRNRDLRIIALASALLAISAAPAQAGRGFSHGVAAQEVRAHSAILWGRATKAGPVRLEIRRRGRFGRCGGTGSFRLRARRENDLTVQRRVRGLKAAEGYRYRFCRRGGRSRVGRFRTAPRPRANEVIRFAWSGDQDGQPAPGQSRPYWNGFGVLRRMRAERNHFNLLLGDTIYSDSEVAGIVSRAITVPAKWAKYRQVLRQRPLAALRSSTASYSHWDDHEFINDFSRAESASRLDIPISPEQLYRNGVRAFRDYNPLRYTRERGIYRRVRWGRNLELFFLDERSFRSAKADAGGACDNPSTPGQRDVAPTLPQDPYRDELSAFFSQVGTPAPPGCLAAINSPSRTMLGAGQLSRFKQAIASSNATFKVVINEVPIQQFYALPYDRWEGYEHERRALLAFLRDNVDNVVFLSTDVHANLVNDARLQTLYEGGSGAPIETGMLDVTTGPIATQPFEREVDSVFGTGLADTVRQLFFKPPPPNGVGMRCAALDQFSYGEVTVSAKRLRIRLKNINGAPVGEGTSGLGGECPNRSTFTIAAG